MCPNLQNRTRGMGDGGAASAHDLLGVDGDTLTDMLAGFSFVYHGDGVIGIADEAFAFGIGGEFLAGQPVGSGTFTLGLEVGGGADVGPLHVVAVAQQIEGGDMCCGDRFVGVKELRSVLKGLGAFFVYKQAACTSNNDQSDVGAGKQVGEMTGGLCDLWQGVRGLGAEGVDDHIESGKIRHGQIEHVFGDGVRGCGSVLASYDCGHIMAATHDLLDNESSGFAICCDYCDFHGDSFRVCGPSKEG